MATIQNTGRTLIDTVAPTTADVTYTYDGEEIPIQVCTWWCNTTTDDLWFCTSNNGSVSSWKQITMT